MRSTSSVLFILEAAIMPAVRAIARRSSAVYASGSSAASVAVACIGLDPMRRVEG